MSGETGSGRTGPLEGAGARKGPGVGTPAHAWRRLRASSIPSVAISDQRSSTERAVREADPTGSRAGLSNLWSDGA